MMLLEGIARKQAEETIRSLHYAHSIPSGKSFYFQVDAALVVFSIPANKNLAKFILGRPSCVWELTRLWAPNGHEKNLLTRAISLAASELRVVVPEVEALVSYADPNAGHSGGVYRAASWFYDGQSEESRLYRDAAGQLIPRRKFHSGKRSMKKAEIEALGYTETKAPGKHRFVRLLTRLAKRDYMRHRGLSCPS